MTSAELYSKLEEELKTLMASLSSLNDSDRLEVNHFIDMGEYGLALETLIGAVVENGQKLPTEVLPKICQLVKQMDLTDSPILQYLEK